MQTASAVPNIATIAAALASAWLWWAASRHRVRRVSRHEVLDAADLNRVAIALNHTQMLNSRAASTTACAAIPMR